MKADAAFARATSRGVLHAKTGVDRDAAIIMADRDGYSQLAFRLLDDGPQSIIELQSIKGVLKLCLGSAQNIFAGIIGFGFGEGGFSD